MHFPLRLLASQNSGVGPGPNIDFEIRHHSKITSDRFSLTTRHYSINITRPLFLAVYWPVYSLGIVYP